MNRDTARKLSDSDFWQICHEMHPTTNYTFPAPSPKSGVANGNHDFHQCSTNNNNNIQSESEEISSSSDESLQNLYAKKSRAHRKLLTSHANPVNTQKIYDTIDLFANEKQKTFETNDEISDQIKMPCDMDSDDENDSIIIMDNADDLLIRLADNVHQLKRNVNQMSELNGDGVSIENGSINAFDGGDLIDFSDNWTTHQSESSDRNSSHHDNHLKKVITTAAKTTIMHACVQGKWKSNRLINFHF